MFTEFMHGSCAYLRSRKLPKVLKENRLDLRTYFASSAAFSVRTNVSWCGTARAQKEISFVTKFHTKLKSAAQLVVTNE